MDKVVLAYSGGLDTTYCAIYLNKIKNLEVHALTVLEYRAITCLINKRGK